jgi:hypothetical protein
LCTLDRRSCVLFLPQSGPIFKFNTRLSSVLCEVAAFVHATRTHLVCWFISLSLALRSVFRPPRQSITYFFQRGRTPATIKRRRQKSIFSRRAMLIGVLRCLSLELGNENRGKCSSVTQILRVYKRSWLNKALFISLEWVIKCFPQ